MVVSRRTALLSIGGALALAGAVILGSVPAGERTPVVPVVAIIVGIGAIICAFVWSGTSSTGDSSPAVAEFDGDGLVEGDAQDVN